jgi:hypothetical protein
VTLSVSRNDPGVSTLAETRLDLRLSIAAVRRRAPLSMAIDVMKERGLRSS